MRKIVVVVVVLLVCALVLGAGGGFLLAGENTKGIDETPIPVPTLKGAGQVVMFDCPPNDPNCHP